MKSSKIMFIGAVILALWITYAYSHSITIAYGITELLIFSMCFFYIIKNLALIERNIMIIFLLFLYLSFGSAIVSMNIKSVVLLSISIIIPFALAVMKISFKDEKEGAVLGLSVGVLFLFAQEYFGIMGTISSMGNGINSNTYGFLCFMIASLGICAFRKERIFWKKVFIGLLIASACYFGMVTGTRNVIIVTFICLILIFLPEKIYRNKSVYRSIYIIVLLYILFSGNFIAKIFENNQLGSFITFLTEDFSNKSWGMESRADYLFLIRDRFNQYNIFCKIFGIGEKAVHAHNLFNQLLLTYGYFGTFLIGYIYVYIYEKAYILIKYKKDRFVTGIFIALIGLFLLNGADVFIAGAESCSIIPQFLMGIIMCKYRYYKKSKKILGGRYVFEYNYSHI